VKDMGVSQVYDESAAAESGSPIVTMLKSSGSHQYRVLQEMEVVVLS